MYGVQLLRNGSTYFSEILCSYSVGLRIGQHVFFIPLFFSLNLVMVARLASIFLYYNVILNIFVNYEMFAFVMVVNQDSL